MSWSKTPSCFPAQTHSNDSEMWILGIPLMSWVVKNKQGKTWCIHVFTWPIRLEIIWGWEPRYVLYSPKGSLQAGEIYSIYIHWFDLNLQRKDSITKPTRILKNVITLSDCRGRRGLITPEKNSPSDGKVSILLSSRALAEMSWR